MGVGSKTKFKFSNLFTSNSSNSSNHSNSNPPSNPHSPQSVSNSSIKSSHNLSYNTLTSPSNAKDPSSKKSLDQIRSDNSRLKHSPSTNTLSSNYNTASSIDSRRKTSISSTRPIFKVFSSKSKQDANSSNTNLSAHYPQTPSSLSSPTYAHREYDPDEVIRKSFAEHRTELDELHAGMVELEMQLDGIRLDKIDSILPPPTPSSIRSPQVAPISNPTSPQSQSMDPSQLFERLKTLESELKKEKNETRVEFEAKVEAQSQLKLKERSGIDLQQKLQEAIQKIASLEEQNEKQQQKMTEMQKSYQREINGLKSQNSAFGDEKSAYEKLHHEFNSLSEQLHTTNNQLNDAQSKLEFAEKETQLLNSQIIELQSNEIQLQDQLTTYELTNKAYQLAQSRSVNTNSTEFETIKSERDDLFMKYSKAQEHIQALKFSLESVIQTNISSPPVSSMDSHYLNSPQSNGFSSLPRNLSQRQGTYPNSSNYFNIPNSFNGYSNEHEQSKAQYQNAHTIYSQRHQSTSPPNINTEPSGYYTEYSNNLSQLSPNKSQQSNKLKYPSGHPRRQTFGDRISPTDSELELSNDPHEYSQPEDLDTILRSLIQEKEKLESEYSRIPISKLNVATRKRKDQLEESLNHIDAEISKVKSKIRART